MILGHNVVEMLPKKKASLMDIGIANVHSTPFIHSLPAQLMTGMRYVYVHWWQNSQHQDMGALDAVKNEVSLGTLHKWSQRSVMLMMRTSSYGLSVLGLVLTLLMFCTTSMPLTTLPNTVCLLSSQGAGITVMKNCDPGDEQSATLVSTVQPVARQKS